MRPRVFPALLTIALLATADANASSIAPPRDLGALAAGADAVVLGEAVASRVVRRGSLLLTRTTFAVESVVAGRAPATRLIAVEVPGGALDGDGWLVAGAPRFVTGERYLLPLAASGALHYQLPTLAWGVYHQVRGRDGSELLEPVAETAELSVVAHGGEAAYERPATFRKAELLAHLDAVAAGRESWDAAAALAAPEQLPFEVGALAAPDDCVFMMSKWGEAGYPYPEYPVRWPVWNDGSPDTVTIWADESGDPSIAGGGFAEVANAVANWNATATSITLAYGGTGSPSMTCTSGTDVPPSGTNIVVFNDPCNDITNLSGCSGTLGFGGPRYNSGTHTWDGSPRYNIVGWFVVLNNGIGPIPNGCLDENEYELMLTHEMGHGLGFGHHTDTGALMWGTCCNNFNATDNACNAYYYPPPGPPATPTGVSASDGTSSDHVRVTWSSASGASSYRVYRNTTNNSGGAAQIGSPTTTTFDDTTAVQGTTYWYWVAAHNASGDSGYSTPDTGYRATCPGAPPTPVVTAPDYAAAGQAYSVSWTATSPDSSYEVQQDDNVAFSSPTTYTVSGTLRSFTNTVGTYYFRVRARDQCGGTTYLSDWSATDSTQVIACGAPPTPTATAPPAADSATSYTVTWTPVALADSYQIQEATSASFSGATTATTSGTSRSYSHTVTSARTYYYRVRARDDCGGTLYYSAYSPTQTTVVSPCAAPAAPALSAPASANPGASYTVSWTGTSPDPSYQLQEATDAAFTGASTFTQSGTSKTFSHSPAANTTYHYRARAANACGGTTYYSAYSGTGTVQVNVCTPPLAPGLASPAAGAKVPAPAVTLTWSAVSGATSYDVHFGQGDPPLVANVTGTSYAVAVAEGQTYNWKVIAKNVCGQAASLVRSFTVCSAAAPPAASFTWAPQGAAPGFPGQQQPYVGQTVQFTDQSTNSPTTWSWYDFQGAGVIYTVPNPAHVFTSAGGKNVRLRATNCQGTSNEALTSVTVYADTRPVTADFAWTPSPVVRDTATTFTAVQGYAAGDPTEFSWTFADTGAVAAGAVASHTFACPGTFDVVLTARRGAYQQTSSKSVTVGGEPCCTAAAAPVAAFAFAPQGPLPDYPEQLQPYVGQPVQLTDQSSDGPTAWSWFGTPDGTAITTQHPVAVWAAAGTYTVGLTATNCKGSTSATQQITVHPYVRPIERRFDFGTTTSPVEPGHTAVTPATWYVNEGYGWWQNSGVAVDSRNRTTGTDLTRDLNFGTDSTFQMDVPNGIYDVTVTLGDAVALHDLVGVFLEDQQLDTVSTARGQWVSRVYQVAVADGRLAMTLKDLGGVDRFFTINALAVVTAPTRRFDFGIPGSAVEAGFVAVPHTLRYSPERGYGWLSGSVAGRDRTAGTSLSRDINFSTLATFAVDLPNGEYDVTARLGDMGAGHDQMGLLLEGTLVASLTTAAGQYEVRTYRTTVADGQLTVLLDDLGGTDVNVTIMGLEVAAVGPPTTTVTLPGGVPLVLARVPAGTFAMGSADTERGRLDDEGPQHTVRLTRAYLVGATEVTQAQWQAVMGGNPATGAGVGPDLPVYSVTWDAVAGVDGFLERLNEHLAATAQVGAGSFRLPTEAEWEHAARAGATTRFAFGDAAACGDGCASCPDAEAAMWWCGNAGSTNHEAATLEPNALGVFDAHGNVWEWVADYWGPYTAAAQVDPTGPTSGTFRVVRGGDSFAGAADCRAARREYQAPDSVAGNIGVRLARSE